MGFIRGDSLKQVPESGNIRCFIVPTNSMFPPWHGAIISPTKDAEKKKRRGARCAAAFLERFDYFFFAFGGTMASLNALASRNFTTVFAAILMVSPVAGF